MTSASPSADHRKQALRLTDSVPVVDDAGADHEQSCDWPDAHYGCDIGAASGPGGDAWTASHEISGAPGIQKLLASGHAAWAVETRCAYALHIGLADDRHPGSSPADPMRHEQRVSVNAEEVGRYSDLWLCPGVVVVKDGARLDPTGTAWGAKPIPVGRGRWLAKGRPVKASHGARSMLQFMPKPEMDYDGQVKLSLLQRDGDYCFQVAAHPDRIQRLQSGPPLIMCWAAALAKFPLHDEFGIHGNGQPDGWTVPGSRNADAVMRVLLREEVPLWGPSPEEAQEWDPMWAATAFLGLERAPVGTVDEEDDE